MNRVEFLLLTQFIIFLLGWPLEWTEIIIIFVPIFLPLLKYFHVDPIVFGILVALNIQTSFNTPPMAMAAYYLKGVAPPQVRLTQIFGGSLPFVFMVFITMALLYIFPGHCALAAASALFQMTTVDRPRPNGRMRPARGASPPRRKGSGMAEGPTLADTIAALRDGVDQRAGRDGILPRAHRGGRPRDRGLGLPRSRTRAGAGARARRGARQRPPLGPLHGIPVGVKDIFDTDDMPTEDGTVLHAGRQPMHDCTAVSLLRQAGAVIMGKTVTTELALFTPGKTRNPHDPERTPGGSSSGSAAAVAVRHGAAGDRLADQRLGHPPGVVLRRGRLQADARPDLAPRRAAVVAHARPCRRFRRQRRRRRAAGRGPDGLRCRRRRHAAAGARRSSSRMAAEEPPLPPKLAFAKTPVWDQADADTQEAFAELVDMLGDSAVEVELPSVFDNAVELHRTIQDAEVAVNFAPEYEQGRDRLSARLREIIEHGQQVPAGDYIRALARIPLLNLSLDEIFDRYDAILTPAAPGEAPRRPRQHRQSGLLHGLDAAGHAGDLAAAAARRKRHADRRAARRPARQ